MLASCYRNSLRLAADKEIKTLAFPAISCGAYGNPITEATHAAVETTRDCLSGNDRIAKVIFALWSEEICDAYRRLLQMS